MHEVIIEQVHNREGSNKKIQFKGVLNKVLVSGLILATATGMVTPAFAAQETIKDAVRDSAFEMTVQETVQGVIVEITNTLKSIAYLRAKHNFFLPVFSISLCALLKNFAGVGRERRLSD